MPSGSLGLLILVVIIGLFAAGALFCVIKFLRGICTGGALPYEPIPVIFPPVPVQRSWGSILVGVLGTFYGAGHVIIIVLWWINGWVIARTGTGIVSGSYVCLLSGLVLVGGLFLLKCKPAGRKLIAWGLVLLSLLAMFALIASLMLPRFTDAPIELRRTARTITYVAAGHIIFDLLLGYLAQKVGRPKDYVEPE